MELFLLDNFINSSQCEIISKYCRSKVTFGRVKHTFSCLGQSSALKASSISDGKSIYPYTGEPESDEAIRVISALLYTVNQNISELFNKETSLVQVCYNIMGPGSMSHLHSDSTDLDGNYGTTDGTPEIQEFSAVLYLNSWGEDYRGGEIVFPKQNLKIQPKSGQLIIFRGNEEYPHMIEEVESGMRESIPMFFGQKINISDRGITSFVENS